MIKKVSEFINQVHKEAQKVVWAPRREVIQVTGIVLLIVVISALFFLGIDMIMFNVIQYLLSFKGA